MTQKDKNIEKIAPSKSQETATVSVEEEKNTVKNDNSSQSESVVKSNHGEDSTKNTENHTELENFFLAALQDIYYAEDKIEASLAKIKTKATSEELHEAIENHELQTKKQLLRLEKVFKHLGEEAKKKKCDAIDGILSEVDEMVKSTKDGSMTRDVAIIIGAQKVEHYEIATYGGLAQIAITLGYEKIADLLETTLEEEEDTDALLTEIAEEYVNFEAEKE